MKLVTIVMAAFNAEQTIAKTVESLIDQTYAEKEIIITNDGSTDATPQILDDFAARYPDLIQVIHQPNQGQSIARNAALERGKGHFIAFMDSDDLWAPNKLERQVEYLTEHPEIGLVYTEGRHIDTNDNLLERFDNSAEFTGNCFETLYVRNNIVGTSVMTRRAVLDDVGTFVPELRACENWELWTRISSKYPIQYIDEELTFYRRHDSNMTSNIDKMRENRLKAIAHNHAQYHENMPNEPELTRLSYYMAHKGFAGEYLGGLQLAKARLNILQALKHRPQDFRLWGWYVQACLGKSMLLLLRRCKNALRSG